MKNRSVLSYAGGGGSFLNRIIAAPAFTMAEILLSLTIIGVVAAITLPSLTGNINERTWATQKKALYARMSQAFPLLDSINTYDDAESFIAGALNTVTKINNVCSQENLEDCGINTDMIGALTGGTIPSYKGTWSEIGIEVKVTLPDTATDAQKKAAQKAAEANWDKMTAAFETGNGESVVLMYNPNCVPDQEMSPASITKEKGGENWFKYVCVNMVYDLNNNKGPNTVGKDIGFMTVFYPTDSVVVSTVPDIHTAGRNAKVDGSDTGAVASCNDSEYRLPNMYEAISMALNNLYVTGSKLAANVPIIVSSSKASDGSDTYIYVVQGNKLETAKGSVAGESRCVKR